MQRVSSPYWLRAEGAVVPWLEIARRQLEQQSHSEVEIGRLLEERLVAAKKRSAEVHLRWSCSERLGLPFEPFTIWVRPQRDHLDDTDLRVDAVEDGLRLRWFGVAAIIDVECDVVDPARAVGLFATRGGGSLIETVGAAAVRQPAGGRVRLRLRTSGATRATLVNGSDPTVLVQRLQDVIDDPAWRMLERAGLPADDPWGATAYRAADQGLLAALTDPVSAALERLARGGPPIGWGLLTESGRLAPTWTPPDPKILLDEIRGDLLPRVEAIFRPGLLPFEQAAIREQPAVARPSHGGMGSSLEAHADLSPLSLLALPGASEPFLALAAGFGTAYPAEDHAEIPFGRADFLVTAPYEETPRSTGPVEVAAFVPAPGPHGAMPSPTGLTATRAGLVAPEIVDGPWRETVRVSWNRLPGAAALARPSGAVAARFEPGGPPVAESLMERRAAGDVRPLLSVPEGAERTPGFARTGHSDAAAEIPLGAGVRHAGYAVAVEDVFGIWSRWEDVLYAGTEPGPPRPRVISLGLTSTYAGTPSCPAVVELELGVDWADRTPTGVDVACVFFPMATAATPPPPAAGPELPAPAGCFRLDVALPFAGDTLVGPAGSTVEHLDSAGQELETPGPAQGAQGRRYRVGVAVPTLDFGSTPRWGVRAWVRGRLLVLPAPTPWSPDPTTPAIAVAGSPVPVTPLPPPLPPGVPLGSTPDAEGRSHARVHWSLPAGAPVAKVAVWEVAETALRESAGLPARAPERRLPGERLADLWAAYDAMTPTRRRSAFRRVAELPGTARDHDVALPRGSTDIHLFAVTTMSTTAVESPWPGGAPPHEHLQAVMAPRLRRPAASRVRSAVEPSGVRIDLAAASTVPVASFRLFRTRSAVAARSAETMGPPFATVPAVAPGPGSPVDPTTGERVYTATWSGTFDPSWDEWLVRVVAVPVDVVPVEAVRGVPSAASEPVSLLVPPAAPPDLGPLVAELWGPGHDGVVVTTSTSVPARSGPLGSHRLGGVAGGTPIAPVLLEAIDEHAAAVPPPPPAPPGPPPPGATPGPVLVRGTRSAGRSPLALWFTRPVAGDPVDVVLRLVDPLGRVTEQRLTVPGWVPAPPPSLQIVGRTTIAGRGTVFELRSDAPVEAAPPFVLEVVAASRIRMRPGPIGRWGPLLRRPRPVTASFPLPEIPSVVRPFRAVDAIQALRTNDRAPFEYSVLVRVVGPFHVRFAMVAPDGARAQVEATDS